MKQVLVVLVILAQVSCIHRQGENLSALERDSIILEVKNTLTNYYADIKRLGLIAEFSYLDSSSDFFWVPPGYSIPLPFDTVSAILRKNAAKYSLVDNGFDTLTIIPLKRDLASYTGRIHSVMISTSGNTSSLILIETGTVIKRGTSWKLLCGQTNLIPK